MSRKHVSALAAALLLTACQQATPGPAVVRDQATLRMHPMPAGSVVLDHTGSTGVIANVNMTGLQPDSRHPVLAGSPGCGVAGKVSVGMLEADPEGKVSAALAIGAAVPDSAPGGVVGMVITVGPGIQDGAEAAALACADVPAAGPAQLAPAPAFGRARVSVEMSYERAARILTVRVRASGLEPGTRHPNHIHTGQCESEGPVREVLHTLVADDHGNVDVTTPIPQSDGIKVGAWYVAVHTGPRLESQAQYALLACGNVASVSAASTTP